MKIDLPWFTSLLAFGLGSIALVALTLSPTPRDADDLEHAVDRLEEATERLEILEQTLGGLHAQLALEASRPATVVMPSPALTAEDAITCVHNRCVVDREYAVAAFDESGTFSRQARVVPSIREGEHRGFKLYGMRPGSAGRALGLRNGDLVTAVGGRPMTDLGALTTAMQALWDESEFSVDFERQQDRHRIHVELR